MSRMQDVEKKHESLGFSDNDISDPRILDIKPYRRKRNPVIVEFLNPKLPVVDIQKAMEAGMNILKISMAYSTMNDKIELIKNVELAAQACREKHGIPEWPVAICATLKTCMVKTGLLENDLDSVDIEEGSEVVVTNNPKKFDKCSSKLIFMDNPQLTVDLKPGMEINISQAELVLECLGPTNDCRSMRCVVTKGGPLRNMCCVSVRGMKYSRPYLTKKDLQILKFCVDYKIDMIIINYVRNIITIKKVRRYLKQKTKDLPVILCGICTQTGLDNIDDVLKECDGMIMARDYLPYELDKSKQFRLSAIQKYIAGKCIQAGKPLFLSGGVLHNIIKSGDILDREISDITNAIMDGVSGFILKNCYNMDYFLDTMLSLYHLSCFAEPLAFNKAQCLRNLEMLKVPVNAGEAALMSCVLVANQMNAPVIILPTVSGRTVRALLAMRPCTLIITVSTKRNIIRLLFTCRCVIPLLYIEPIRSHKKHPKTEEARIQYAVNYAVVNSWIDKGDTYVTLQRSDERSGFCDTVRIFKVTDTKKNLMECPDDTEEQTEPQPQAPVSHQPDCS